MAEEIKTITEKENNVRTEQSTLSNTTHLIGMLDDGTPVRLPMSELTLNQTELDEEMKEQIKSVYNDIPDVKSKVETLIASTQYVTEDEYDALVESGEVKEDVEYDIYEE